MLLSRYRKTVTFKEPLKSHVSSPLAPRSSGGLTSLAEDEALNSMGEREHHPREIAGPDKLGTYGNPPSNPRPEVKAL